MKIVFRTAAFVAFILTAAAIGLATAATPAKADGWRHGNVWAHGHGRDHRRHWRRGHGRTVVVVRPLRLYAPPPRVVYRRAPVIVQQAPVVVQQAPVVQTAAAYCREYTETVTIAGQVRTAFGTACLQPDGSWQKQD